MKKIARVLCVVVAIFFFGLIAQPATAVSTNDEIERATATLVDAIDKYNAEFDLAEDSEAVSSVTEVFKRSVIGAKESFQVVASPAGNNELKGYAARFTGLIDEFIVAVDGIEKTVVDYDPVAYEVAVDKYNNLIDEYNLEVDGYNQYIKSNPLASGDAVYATWFIVLAVSMVCLLLAAIIFATGRKQHGVLPGSEDGKKKPVALKDVRRGVLLGAVLFVVGAAIPAVQYYVAIHNAGPGGEFTYYIFWELLIIGAIFFAVSLVQYCMTYAKLKKAGQLTHSDDATAMAMEKLDIGTNVSEGDSLPSDR